jgi:hypothetical protein
MMGLHIAFKTASDSLRRYPDWPKVQHLACELFGHATFDAKTWERLENWLLTEHAASRSKFLLMEPSGVVDLLRKAVEAKATRTATVRRKAPRGKGGRRRDTDPVADAKLRDEWEASGLATYAQFAARKKMDTKAVKDAIDRARKRPSQVDSAAKE